jgi:hypothetical protein
LDIDDFDLVLLTWLPVPAGVLSVLIGLALDSPVLLLAGAALILGRFGISAIPWDSW